MQLIDKIKIVLFQPDSFFVHLKKEEGLKPALIYLVLLSLFSAAMTTVVYLLLQHFSPGLLQKLIGADQGLTLTQFSLTSLGNYVLGLLASFFAVGILFVWLYLFGGRVPYSKTFQLFAYANTPAYLLGWIPFVNILTMVWSLLLYVKGTRKVYGFTLQRTLSAYGIALLLLILFSAFIGYSVAHTSLSALN